MGNGKMAERGGGRRDFFGDGGDGRPRGSPLPVLVGVRRDGCPHARGQREEEDCCSNEIPRLRCAALGMTCCQGEWGVGPRIREDTGGMDSRLRLHGGRQGGRGWVPTCARRRTGGGGFPSASSRGQAVSGGDGDGSPHPRGQWEGKVCRFRLHGGRL